MSKASVGEVNGYRVVFMPEHPRTFTHRGCHSYVYEHIVEAEKMLGRSLTASEVVHHKNSDRADNRHENLLVTTNSTHTKLHHMMRCMLDVSWVGPLKLLADDDPRVFKKENRCNCGNKRSSRAAKCRECLNIERAAARKISDIKDLDSCSCGELKNKAASVCLKCHLKTKRDGWVAPDGTLWNGTEVMKRLSCESFLSVGRSFGISDNAVRKRLQAEGFVPPKGHRR